MEEWLRKARFHPPRKPEQELLAELDLVLGGREPTPEEGMKIAEILALKYLPDLL